MASVQSKKGKLGKRTYYESVEKVPLSSLRATAKQYRALNANEIATSLRSSL